MHILFLWISMKDTKITAAFWQQWILYVFVSCFCVGLYQLCSSELFFLEILYGLNTLLHRKAIRHVLNVIAHRNEEWDQLSWIFAVLRLCPHFYSNLYVFFSTIQIMCQDRILQWRQRKKPKKYILIFDRNSCFSFIFWLLSFIWLQVRDS